jgi:hypothetical protein
MKALTAFFKGLGMTLAIYVTILVTPALTAVILTGDWNKYTDCMNSGEYVAIFSFIAVMVILVFWSAESDK